MGVAMARAASASAFRTLPAYLGTLHRALLAQCLPGTVDAAARAVRGDGGGLVVTAERGDTAAVLDAAGRIVRDGRFAQQPVLLDAARYAGPDRSDGRAPFSPEWLR